MPKFPFDLSNFEKISASDKKTTLKHKDGHFIVIAHAKLKPDLQKGLASLPFAKGGKVPKGYLLEHIDKGEGQHSVHAKDKKGQVIGHAHFKVEGKNLVPHEPLPGTNAVEVDEDHQRKGVASAMYSHAEKQTKKKLIPSSSQTDEGEALWAQKNRPFGKKMADGGEVQKEPKQPPKKVQQVDPNAAYTNKQADSMEEMHKQFMQTQESSSYATGGAVKMKDGGDPKDALLEKTVEEYVAPPQEPKETPFAEVAQDFANHQIDGNSAPLSAGAPPALPADQALQADAPPPEAPAAPETPPQAAAPPAPAQKAPAPDPTPGQEMLQERNNFADDLASGQIHPKTYQDLYNSKDTLGKIGTMFGLMLGGLGHGHSNSVLQMMDKIIDRDLHAQETSASNRQNFYKIRQQQQMNDAVVKRYAVENKLTLAQAREALAKAGFEEINLDQAKKWLGEDASPSSADDLQAKNQAKMDMHVAALHHLDQQVQKLPPGAMKDNASATLGSIGQQVLQGQHPQLIQQSEAAHTSEAEHKAQKGLQDMKDKNHILVPNADKLFSRANYDPLIRKNPSLASELDQQYTAAKQADAATDAVIDSFDKLKHLRSWGARAYGAVGPGSLGALGAGLGASVAGTKGAEAGAGIGASIGHLVPSTSSIREYEAEKAKLQGLIGNALAAAKLTPTDVGHMIDKYAPVQGDDDSALNTKLEGILDKIRLSIPRSRLQHAKMTK